MFERRRSAPPALAPTAMRAAPDPVDEAWRIHDALAEWTGKVDTKASFALTIESALLAGVVALSHQGSQLNSLHHRDIIVLYDIGVAMLGAGVLAAASVVMPRLTPRKTLAKEASSNYVYFGHLRYWRAADLEVALRHNDVLPVLARALVSMSQHAWTKYLCMQLSLMFSALGAALIVIVLLVNR
jgi:hypothetical protein